MSWINTKVRKTGKINEHRASINLEYVIYVGESAEGLADFYLSSENWLCSTDMYDDIVKRLEEEDYEEES